MTRLPVNKQDLIQWCATHHEGSLPLIMGVLNITPNSFSDGGCYLDKDAACRRVEAMIEQGVDLIDLGGEASNPGSKPIGEDEELSRVIPILTAIRNISDIAVSIDTSKPVVMSEAVNAGAAMINDITALMGEGALQVAKDLNVPIVLMHMRGTPQTMQKQVDESLNMVFVIQQFFAQRLAACEGIGIPSESLILDPGIGFGKSLRQNLQIMNQLSSMRIHKRPLLIGVSRKSLLGELLQKPIDQRMVGGIAMAMYALMHGVKIIRTHDVDETRQMIHILNHLHHETR